jgi:replicative DNA helicase
MEGRIMPQALDTEQAVLGACLGFKGAYVDASALITSETFYSDANKAIFEAVGELSTNNRPIDMVTVVDCLKKASKLELVGGVGYVACLPGKVMTGANVEYHCAILKEKQMLRQQIELAGEVMRLAYESDANPFDIEDLITSTTLSISSVNTGQVKHIKDVLPEVIKSAENKGGLTGMATGITKVDATYYGRQNSDLIIKAARPSMGKTAHMLTEAKHQSMDGKNVLIFSLEMSNTQLAQRITAMDSGVNLNAIRNGGLSTVDFAFMNDAIGRIEKSKLWLVDNCFELRQILSLANKRKLAGLCDIIYIDYLQLIGNKSKGNREQEVSDISRKLKMMAKTLDVPVIALSQLSRAVEARADKRPMLSDLRESGSLEQDADVVEFLWRPEYYGITDIEGYGTAQGLAFLLVAKNRNGAIRDVPMRWLPEKVLFTDWLEGETYNVNNQIEPNNKFDEGWT